MIRVSKVRTIAQFELLTAVKRLGYLITTFGMPVFVAAYGALIAIPAYFAAQAEKKDTAYAVVDVPGVLRLERDVKAPLVQLSEDMRKALESMGQGAAVEQALGESNFVFRPYASEPDARAALAGGRIEGYFVLPADYIERGRVEIYRPASISLRGSDARAAFGNLLRERLAAGRVDPALAARLVSPMRDQRRFTITRTGEVTDGGRAASMVRLAIPLAFMLLFLMSILMTSGYLMQGTATEKENKVVDVLLASANPDEILAGKLLGLGGAGLLQIAVWMAMALATGVGVIPLVMSAGIEIPWLAVWLAIPLFAMSFMFFGALILGSGSLGSNMREAQQFAMVWSLTAAVPLMLLSILLQNPHGTLARVFTWLPFSAGSVIILRASMEPEALAWWEIGGAALVLLASIWVAIKVGARLFRVGLLSAGSRPGLREILRQARLT